MAGVRIVFMGTPEMGATCLRRLREESQFEILAAVSQPDRPKGRQLRLQPTPVKTAALETGIPILQPSKARHPDLLKDLRAFGPDLIVVVAYGQILPPSVLDLPKHGCLNLHTSLLPRYRGAAPIQWAILNGDSKTGVTVMRLVPELDAGDIVSQCETKITASDTAQTLHDRLARLGADLLVKTIPGYIAGTVNPVPQPAAGVVHARKITKADGRIDWGRSAREIWNQVRGLTPWPGAFTYLPAKQEPMLIKLWRVQPEAGSGAPGTVLSAGRDGIAVATPDGTLRIHELQPEGRRRMTAEAFLAGHRIRPGEAFVASSAG